MIVQAVRHQLLERPLHGIHRLPVAGQREREIRLRLGQLVRLDRFGAQNAPQLPIDLDHGFLRLVGLHGRVGDERALAARIPNERERPIRPVLCFTEIHVDTRRELPAEQ